MSALLEAETWVAISFLIFCGILVYVGVPKLLTDALDKRAKRVQDELDEARRQELASVLTSMDSGVIGARVA